MNIINELQQEHTEEYQITKKFIELYPEDKNDWKPHDKSNNMLWLAIHVVEIFAWPDVIMNTECLDFAETPYTQPPITTRAELLKKLDDDYAAGSAVLKNMEAGDLDGSWDIRQGEMVFMKWTKYGALRHAMNQITHHRAQLGMYYRLNDIKVPASYGPSADEM